MAHGYVSAREAARQIGRSEKLIRKWIEQGRLKAERDPQDRTWSVPVSEVERALGDGVMRGPGAEPEPVAQDNGVVPGELAGWMLRAIRAEERLRVLATLAREYGDGNDAWRVVGLVGLLTQEDAS